MSEFTKHELLSQFYAMAEGATPNSEECLEAQAFFKEHIVRTSADDAKNSHLSASVGGKYKDAFLTAVATMVTHRNGGQELFASRTYEQLIGDLPAKDQNPNNGIKAVLRPLEVQFGVREPAFGFGK